MTTITKTKVRKSRIGLRHPLLLTPQERLSLLRKTYGMWKDRKPDPIKELKKMRKEWNRELPPLR